MTCNQFSSRPLLHPHGSEMQRTTCKRISALPPKHKQFRYLRRPAILLVLLGALFLGACSEPDSADSVFFLVRHAEKQTAGDDPALGDAGRQRAERLADLLADARLNSVHSTDFRRTLQTARPAAARHGLDVRFYDPATPGTLLEDLRQRGGRHLLVGHSNTVPGLVEQLGGEGGPAIEEQGEYDRLYVVTIGADGRATTLLLRYGERSGR